MAPATNSNLFIKGEVLGMKRLSTNPARKAPKIPSSPHSSAAIAAERKTTAIVKVKSMMGSLNLRKKTLIIRGSTQNMNNMKIPKRRMKKIQNKASIPSPFITPDIPARKRSAESRAIIVASTETVTEGSFVTPYLPTIE